jgi:carbonic anhydrase/acetyltransferase-like protein (isoleucine patch superfamily)
MNKYKLTDQTIQLGNKTLYRIEALKKFVIADGSTIRPGDVGGYIENEKNLSQEGNAWVYSGAWVFGKAEVYGSAQVYGDTQVFGNAQVYGEAQVLGNARVHGDAWVFGKAWVFDNARVSGDTQVFGNAQVYGDAQVFDKAQVYGNAQVYGDAEISGSAWVYGNAEVYDHVCLRAEHISNANSLLYLSNTSYYSINATATHFRIGCQTHAWKEYEEQFEALLSKYHATATAAAWYRLAFKMAKEHFGTEG